MDIAYICIFASHLEESVLFYRDILGLVEDLSRSDENFRALRAGSTYIGIERKGVRKDGEKTKAENPILIQFKASSLQELQEITKDLEAKNVTMLKSMVTGSYGTFTNFLDPDGNKLEILYQP